MNQEHVILESGTLKQVSGAMPPFSMRLLDYNDLPGMYDLRDTIEASIPEWDMFLPTPDEVVRKGLGSAGISCGVFVDNRLVGLRSFHFPASSDPENVGRYAGVPTHELDKVVELKLSLVDPEYRGNRLQKRMTAHLMALLDRMYVGYRYCCAIVSPKNVPSLSDKFAMDMRISRMIMKNNEYWRCVFSRDFSKIQTMPTNQMVYASNRDFETQSRLIDQGFLGYQLTKTGNNTGEILYAK